MKRSVYVMISDDASPRVFAQIVIILERDFVFLAIDFSGYTKAVVVASVFFLCPQKRLRHS